MELNTFTNELLGVVVVKATDPISEYYKEFADFYKRHNMIVDNRLFDDFTKKFGHQIYNMDGRATCNVEAGDDFDFEYGAKLAKERYLKSFETFRINMYSMIFEKVYTTLMGAKDRMYFAINRRDWRDSKINSIITRAE